MKKTLVILFLGLLLVSAGTLTAWGQSNETEESYTVWFGGHYTGFDGYTKKVGEYMINKEELLPEFKVDYLSRGRGYVFTMNGHYFDDKNIMGTVSTRVGNRFRGDFGYKSLIHQEGQDLLANLETREAGGGKILTHELLDPNADYNTHRQEIESNIEALLSEKHDIKLMVAHRTVLQSGTEQAISNNHCFSCHVVSQEATVDKITHQIVASLQGEVARQTVGYDFSFRTFESKAPEVTGFYDPAVHPVSGASGAEFSSRMIYSDTTLPINQYPKTDKFQHKIRSKGELAGGQYASAVSYSHAKNRNDGLVSTAWAGNLNYSYPVGKKSRLVAKLTGTRLMTDNVYIDLPLFRHGRPGPQTDFSEWRYSSLNRATGKGTLELISRLNPRLTGSILLGLEVIDRYDYPVYDNGTTTKRFIGQVKAHYRKGMKYSTRLKYRFEKTSDPFVSGRGLFEAPGRDVLNPLTPPANFPFVFYWQREELRYQAITMLPTQEHDFEWTSQWRPNQKVNVNLGLKGKYDKNGDLDSLDVNHLSLQPHLALNLNPNSQWSIMTGGSYIYYKSRGPVTVALFDG